MEVTREDFNGLSERVTEYREHQIGCQANTKQRLNVLEDQTKHVLTTMAKTHVKLDDIDKKTSVMWAKITAAVAVLMLLMRFIPI